MNFSVLELIELIHAKKTIDDKQLIEIVKFCVDNADGLSTVFAIEKYVKREAALER